MDGPVHGVIFLGKNAADHYGQSAEINQALGDEGRALWKELLSTVRKTEHRNGQLRPELGTERPVAETTDSNR